MRPLVRRTLLAALLLAPAVARAGAAASAWRLDDARSTFAVLTHRAGPAARLAHDHLIVARAPRVEIDFEPGSPSAARVEFAEPVLALDVDPAAERAALEPQLRALGILRETLGPVDDGERAKVRVSMLAARQLFSERFPEIRAHLDALAPHAEPHGATLAGDFPWQATLRIDLRGESVAKQVPLDWRLEGGELHARLVAAFRFTEFRIEPYSAFLGAVRNEDLFHVVVNLVATRAAEETP